MSVVQLSTLGTVIKTAYEGLNPAAVVYMSSLNAGPTKTQSENTTAFQSALDLIATTMNGNGRIFFDIPGEYDITSVNRTSGLKNLVIDGAPGVILNGNNVDHTTDAALIRVTGVALSSTTVTSAVAAGATTLTLESTAGLTAGMPFYIRSSSEYFNGASGVDGFPLVRKYEVNRVQSVDSATQITLQYATEDSYSITGHTITLVPYTPINVVVTENIFFKGGGEKADLNNGQGQRGIYVELFDSVLIEGMRAGGWQGYISLCRIGFNHRVNGGDIYGLADRIPVDCFYGHVVDGVRDSQVTRVHSRNMRRCADTGVLYITRDMRQNENFCVDMNGGGVGTHHGDRIYIHDNIVNETQSGIVLRSKNSHAYRNIIRTSGTGVTVGTSGVAAPTPINNMGRSVVADNTIIITGSSSGVVAFLGHSGLDISRNNITTTTGAPILLRCSTLQNLIVADNTLTATNNTLTGVNGVYVSNTDALLTTTDRLFIGRNRFIGTYNRVIRVDAPNVGSVIDNLFIETPTVTGTYRDLLLLDRTRTGTNINVAMGAVQDGAGSGFRNLIVNGSGQVNERQGSGTDIINASLCALDRWVVTAGPQALRLGTSNVSLPTQEFSNWIQVQNRAVPLGTPGAAVKYALEQAIIGVDFAALKWGTNEAVPLTLTFYSRIAVNTPGTYTLCVALQNGARNRSYVRTYQLVDNTVGLITLTFPGDKTGTWATDNTAGARLVFDLGCGSNFETTADAWQAGNFCRVAGTYRAVDIPQNNTIRFAVQLTRGVVPMPLERRPLTIERQLCNQTFQRRPVWVAAAPAFTTVPIDMLGVPAVSGGGAGVATTGTTANCLLINQTTAALQTILLDAEPAF